MGAMSVRLFGNFKAIAATLVLAALLLAGLAATFGFAPFGNQYGTDRAATRPTTELAATAAPPPVALASSSSQAVLTAAVSAPAATPVEEARTLPRKPTEFAHAIKRRVHRLDLAPPAVAIEAASHQIGNGADGQTAHLQPEGSGNLDDMTDHVARTTTIDSVGLAVVDSSDQDREMPDRAAVQQPASQHVELTVSVFDNPTELHPLSDQELAAVSASDGAMGIGGETPST